MVLAFERARDHDLIPASKRACRFDLRGDLFFACRSALGDDQDLRRILRIRELRDHPFVSCTERLGCIEQECCHIHTFERLDRGGVQLFSKRIMRLVKTRRIHDDKLVVFGGVDRAEAMARCLRGR